MTVTLSLYHRISTDDLDQRTTWFDNLCRRENIENAPLGINKRRLKRALSLHGARLITVNDDTGLYHDDQIQFKSHEAARKFFEEYSRSENIGS